MKLTPDTLAETLYLMTRDRSEAEARLLIARFLEYVLDRFGPRMPAKVLERLPAAAKKAEGIEDVLVETARPLPASAVNRALKELGIDRAKADVELRVDPELIGGIRIRRRDTVFDATIKNQLSRLGKLPAKLTAEG